MVEHVAFNFPKSLIFGEGSLSRLPEIVKSLGCTNPLVVSDGGLARIGLVKKVQTVLCNESISFSLFHDVEQEPVEDDFLAAYRFGKQADSDCIIGFGGGTPLDIAKVIAVLLRGKEKLEDLYGLNNVKGGRLPLILIPTTAGTGSEVSMGAVVSMGGTFKNVVLSPVLQPDYAVLDPRLLTELPPFLKATIGVDAIVHAIEGYVTRKNGNPVSKLFSKEALSCLLHNIVDACQSKHPAALANLLLGSMYAGLSFTNSSVASIHALAYPLGTLHHVSHGLSNALLLVPVLKENLDVCTEEYADMYAYVYKDTIDRGLAAQAFVTKIERILTELKIPRTLTDAAVTSVNVDHLIREALKQERLLMNNPKPFDAQTIKRLYLAVK